MSFGMQSAHEVDKTPALALEGCPLCAAPAFKNVRREPEGQLVQCEDCEFLYVWPRPTGEELKALYDQYFSHSGLASALSFRTPVFVQCLRELERLHLTGSRLLDVGCGTGEFVAHAISCGWDAAGIESSAMAAQFARLEKGLPVDQAVLKTAPFPPESFDVITLLDVLEHLLDPREELGRIYGLLKPGGVTVVRLPNTLFHLPKAKLISRLGISESSLEMRYHLNHFTPKTLSGALRAAGFGLLSVKVGAPETTAHAAWTNPRAKRLYVRTATLLNSITRINLGNIMITYARKPF